MTRRSFRGFGPGIHVTVMMYLALGSVAAFGVPTAFEPWRDPNLGFNLISWGNFGSQGASAWQTAVQQLHNAGFREVSISPLRFIVAGTGALTTTSSSQPELSHIEAGIIRAKQLGMKVTLNPFVEPQNFTTWRGFYNPTPGSPESNRFWADYQQYLTQVAALGQAHGVEAMNIGTELKALEGNPGHNGSWTSVINAVNNVFTGSLGYAANWDSFKGANLTSTIWEHPAIDYLGIDAYFRIVSDAQADASGTDPNPAFINLVTNAWTNRLTTDILPFAQARKNGAGMPVIFTEYGAAPFNRGISQNPNSSQVDQGEQRMGFEALLRALDGRQDKIPAMHIWQWGMQGANESWFYTNTNTTSNIGGGFDESLNTPLANWLSAFISNPLLQGDFNQDGAYNCWDIDLLVAGVAAGSSDPLWDLNGDGQVGFQDVTNWLSLAGARNLASGNPYSPGDANLDGVVDGSDFGVWNAHKFTPVAAWCQGDLTADGVIDGSDFGIWNVTKFTSSDSMNSAILPEPGSIAVLLICGVGFACRGARAVRRK